MSVPIATTSGPSKFLALLDEAWAAHLAPREASAPTVASVFAGAGGSSLGYSMAGYRELFAAEWNQDACETLRVNFPEVHVWQGDIRELTAGELMRHAGIEPGQLDVLDGSPPCQGFSTSGDRNFDDARNQLFREFVRLLRGLRPRAFVMENVAGMVRGSMRLIFAEILRELKASGYRVSARLLNAQYFHVPQSRQRMIFIGTRDDLGIEPTHPDAQSAAYPVSMAIGDFGNVQDLERDHIWVDESPAGRHTKTWAIAHRTPQGKRIAGQVNRDTWSKPSHTLLTNALTGKPYIRCCGCHPLYTRTYSLAEVKRLSTIPDAFVFPGDKWHGFTRIGNCVPPFFMRAIARHVRGLLDG